MKSQNVCGFCGSNNLKFQEKILDPLFFDIHAIVFNLNTMFQRRKVVIKCMKCGCEYKPKRTFVLISRT